MKQYTLRYKMWETTSEDGKSLFIVVDTHNKDLSTKYYDYQAAKKTLCLNNTRELKRNQAFRNASLKRGRI